MAFSQSFCLPCFRPEGASDADVLRAAAEIGYRAVEIWGWDDSLDALAETAATFGLKIASVAGHNSIEKGLNDPREHSRIQDELGRSIEKASELEIPGVICFAGNRRAAVSDLDGLGYFLEGIRPVLPLAEEMGVNLNLEILNSRVDHYDYMGDRCDWAIAACQGAASPRLKILFDVYHVQIMEGDLIRNLRRCMPYLGHVHTAGNPGRKDLDGEQEIHYPAIATALRDAGYEGYVAHEFFPKGDRIEGLCSAYQALA